VMHALVGNGPRLCENSARYNRTQNFEACGDAQGKKTQKFILRSALRPNQISFSHSLGQNPTNAPEQTALGSITKSAAALDVPVPLHPWPGYAARIAAWRHDRCGGAT
jgi:hypothetical protein